MKIVESPHEAYAHIDHWRREGLRIGLVPTMGALHEGHLSLVKRSQQECDITAVTIFVNPTQFGPQEDFAKYPRTLEADYQALRQFETDLVFVPRQEDLYPKGYSTYVLPPAVAQGLEGEHRAGHFRGVVTVVMKLFHILPATVAYLGQKDYQQLAVIRSMVEDLNVPIRIQGCETLREADGLAMSSRNRYLTAEQRQTALALWKALNAAKQMVEADVREVAQLEAAMEGLLREAGIDRIDYARVADQETLEPMEIVDRAAIALVAAHVGNTRLIDNLCLDPNETP